MKFKKKKPKKDQLYFIWFDSGYRNYISTGKDLDIMSENLMKKYNLYCSEEYKFSKLSEMATAAIEADWRFNVYIIDINSASDDDYREFENEIYLGDYLEVIRERNLEN